MRPVVHRFAASCCFVFLAGTIPVCGRDTNLWARCFGSVNLGYKQSVWAPGFANKVFDLDTQGLQSYNAGILLGFKTTPLFFYRWEGPVDGSRSQEDLFELNERQDSAMKKMEAGMLLGWLTNITDNVAVKVVSRVEYVHTEETYFGEGVARQKFAYVPMASETERWPDDTVTFCGMERIAEGDAVAFRTRFKEDQLVIVWPAKFLKRSFAVRAGGFERSWRRPSVLDWGWLTMIDNSQIVFETKFRSRGLILGVEPLSDDIPGLNARITGYWSFDTDVSNAETDDFELIEGKEMVSAAGIIDVWYALCARLGAKSRYSLKLGASIDRRVFGTRIDPIWGGTYEKDDLFRTYAQLTVRF